MIVTIYRNNTALKSVFEDHPKYRYDDPDITSERLTWTVAFMIMFI